MTYMNLNLSEPMFRFPQGDGWYYTHLHFPIDVLKYFVWFGFVLVVAVIIFLLVQDVRETFMEAKKENGGQRT